ncbi:MAG: hypothetical protein ACT4P9_10550 [Betaproteobacteria bacterium]
MKRTRNILILSGLASLAPLPLQAQELGRLFLTPEQRAALDARRKARIPDKPTAVPVVESPTTSVDGYVRRQSGRSTVWVNRQPNPEGVQSDGARVAPGRAGAPTVSIFVGEGERRFELKPGQRIDRGTGEISDVLGDGSVRVGPARKPGGK